MQIGEGSAWVGVLVGGLFAAVLLLFLLAYLATLLRRLGRGARGLLSGKAQWPGLGGIVRTVLSELIVIGVLSSFGMFSWVILGLSLVNYFPTVGTWPPLPTVLASMVDERKLQWELRSGVRDQHAGLVRLALKLGADADNSDQDESLLPKVRDPALRQLLIEHGASPDGLPHQQPPLLQAWRMRDFELYNWLLQAGANPDPRLPEPSAHFIAQLARSATPIGDEWLNALLRHAPDLNRRTPQGATVLDVMTLTQLRPDWQSRLREAGARHGLLLDRGQELPADHAAISHVRQWLEARGTAHWQEGDQRWELPGADATGDYYFLPVKDIQLSGCIEGNDALVQARGPAGGGPERTTVVALRLIQAEAAEPVAEADPANRTSAHGSWRIAGFWLDER